MSDASAINTLTKRRAHLAGEIDLATKHMKAKCRELATIDAALRLLDAGVVPSKIKNIRHFSRMVGFKHGDITRYCLRSLRNAPVPISATIMAEDIARAKGIEVTTDLLTKVRASMLRLVRNGRVVRSGVHRARLWALA